MPDTPQLVGDYEIDRQSLTETLVQREMQKKKGKTLDIEKNAIIEPLVRQWASEKAQEVSINLNLRRDGWYFMQFQLGPSEKLDKTTGVWRALPHAVELKRVEQDLKYAHGGDTMQLISENNYLVMLDFRLKKSRAAVSGSTEPNDFAY